MTIPQLPLKDALCIETSTSNQIIYHPLHSWGNMSIKSGPKSKHVTGKVKSIPSQHGMLCPAMLNTMPIITSFAPRWSIAHFLNAIAWPHNKEPQLVGCRMHHVPSEIWAIKITGGGGFVVIMEGGIDIKYKISLPTQVLGHAKKRGTG